MPQIKLKSSDGEEISFELKNGIDGTPGKDGRDGKDGLNGKDGKDGKDGIDGKNGKDGVDGKDGKNGERGPRGLDGKDGKDGRDGRDLSPKDIKTLEKAIKSGDGNLLWVNNGAVRSITAGENIVITGDPQTPTISATSGETWDKPFGDATFTYDVDGNIETKTVGSVVLTFTYDVDGNIETISDGTNTKTFSYDVDGNVETIIYS